MTSSVITFAVRLGSHGSEIARLVAERLDYRFYDWEITSQAAERAGVSTSVVAASEQAQSFLERTIERLRITGVYESDDPSGRLSSAAMSSAIVALGSREYREFVERVVLELSSQGRAVIVGHAGHVVLAKQADVLKVLVTGSVDKRASRVAEDEEKTSEAAHKIVRDSDNERKAFFKQTYSVDLLNADLYDLTLSSDRLSVEAAAAVIIDAVR